MSHDRFDLTKLADVDAELAPLRQKLRRKYRTVDEHLLEESIEEAALHYLACPERFDASRGVPLSYYLWLWVRSHLDKRLRKEKQHREHEKAVGVSGKEIEKIMSGTKGGRGIYLGRVGNEKEIEERRGGESAMLDAIVADLNPGDLRKLQLLRFGASRQQWVRHLGIEHLPRKQQQRKIDAEKDRLRKRLRRRVQKVKEGSASQLGSS